MNMMISYQELVRTFLKNWSMWNDIAILFKTVGVVLKRDGAY